MVKGSNAIRIAQIAFEDSHFQKMHKKKQKYIILEIIEKILAITAFEDSWKDVKKSNCRSVRDSSWSQELVTLFFELSYATDIKLDEIYNVYIVYNILNQFRLKNGYKDGNYIKDWDGKDDSIVAFELASKIPDITPEKLMKKFQDFYQKSLQENPDL